MIKYPNLAYKCPGTHHCPGGTYDYRQVSNENELRAAIEQGWYPTLQWACQGGEIKASDVLGDIEPETDATTPPTREEMEEKAKELGLQFPKNIKDETLLKKIDEAIAEGEE